MCLPAVASAFDSLGASVPGPDPIACVMPKVVTVGYGSDEAASGLMDEGLRALDLAGSEGLVGQHVFADRSTTRTVLDAGDVDSRRIDAHLNQTSGSVTLDILRLHTSNPDPFNPKTMISFARREAWRAGARTEPDYHHG
jgi:hypothetical protein